MRKVALLAAVGVWCALPAVAQQLQLPAPQFAPPNLAPAGAEGLAMSCAICHGPAGHPAPGSTLPALAGQRGEDIARAMREFKEGSRPATVMHQIAKGYSDDEIDAIARRFAREKP